MSQEIGNTQPQPNFDAGSTQPLKPLKKGRRWGSIAISILGVLALLALGLGGGYWSGLGVRQSTENGLRTKQLTEQYQFALVDEQFGHFDSAQQRLQYIIQHDPMFPGAQAELAKVLVQVAIPTATATATITPTPDRRGEEAMFQTARQLTASGDWPNAIAQIDQLRKQDPRYKTALVDGMYYFALRNYGVNLIQHEGNLETGIYELTLAERFAPLDNTANALREGARAYIQASSFFGVDWKNSVAYFQQVASGWPSLWDGTMTASQRYHQALMRYGDQLWAQKDACGAYTQYQNAMAIAELDQTATKNANQAFQVCYPPTATPTIEVVPTGTTPAPTTESPSETPTP